MRLEDLILYCECTELCSNYWECASTYKQNSTSTHKHIRRWSAVCSWCHNYIEVGSIWKWLELYTSLPPAWTFVSLSDGAWSQFRDQVGVVCT